MDKILKHDTDGVKGLLGKGQFGYDDYAAGGDTGRVHIGTGTENIPLAKKSEVDSINTVVANVSQTPINVTGTLDGSFAIVGTDVVATNVIGSISNGFSATGSIVTNDRFTLDGILTPTNGYTDGDNYLKTTTSGTVTSTLFKPLVGLVSATADYYLDGLWYNSSDVVYNPQIAYLSENGKLVKATASGGIIVDEADGSTNTSTTDIVPTMTSPTTPSGIAFGNYDGGASYQAFYAFNNDISTSNFGFYSNLSTHYVGYIDTVAKIVNKYSVLMNSSANINTWATTWQLQGSNDTIDGTDGTWSNIGDLITGESFSLGVRKYFTVTNSTAYKAYRLYDANSGGWYVGEIEFIEAQESLSYTDDAPSIVEKCIQVGSIIANTIKSPLSVSARCSFNGVGGISISEAVGISGITRLSNAYYRIFDDSSNLGRAVVASMSYSSYGGVEIVGIYDGYFEIKLYNTSGGPSESGADLITCIVSGGYN